MARPDGTITPNMDLSELHAAIDRVAGLIERLEAWEQGNTQVTITFTPDGETREILNTALANMASPPKFVRGL